jgi:hypothetical protein
MHIVDILEVTTCNSIAECNQHESMSKDVSIMQTTAHDSDKICTLTYLCTCSVLMSSLLLYQFLDEEYK